MIRKYGVFMLLGLLLLVAAAIKTMGGLPAFEGRDTTADEQLAGAPPAVPEEPAVEPAAQKDYFASFREERESIRNQEMRYLDEVIATSNVDAETLEQAVEQKLALVENMEAEFAIESMITAKGFSDAAVTFHNGAVNVVVGKAELSEAEVAQILDIVHRQTGKGAQDVKVTTGGLDDAIY